MKILVKNGLVVTMNPKREVIRGDVLLENDRIKAIGKTEEQADKVIDATGKVVIPGFVQTHIHLCQALFRGQADDMELLDWLKKRIWPLEATHDEESIYYSAMLGCGELIKGGTTCIVDMETVHHTDSAIQAIYENGMRAITGKVMMDYGSDVPAGLMENTADSLQESVDLLEKWHMKDGGRIRYAFTPRFVVSCTDDLLTQVRDLAQKYGVYVHTHASENRGEIALVEQDRGRRNVVHLEHLGLTGPNLLLAHCIWLDDREMDILQKSGTHVAHCPSSNLKLASGVAMIPEMLDRGISVSLGADGAPCNNNLDAFVEMRLASLIQKVRLGPTAMPARQVFELANIKGAEAIGLADEVGSIEVGKKADLAILDLNKLHAWPSAETDIYSRLVYEAKSSDVETTIIDGKVVMENRHLTTIDEDEVLHKCNESIARLRNKAQIV